MNFDTNPGKIDCFSKRITSVRLSRFLPKTNVDVVPHSLFKREKLLDTKQSLKLTATISLCSIVQAAGSSIWNPRRAFL